MGYGIGRGRGAHAPRGCAMWGGGAVLHEVRPYSGWWAARCGAELGERVYAEGKMMRGKYLGICGGSKGKQKSRRAVGLAGRELYFAK